MEAAKTTQTARRKRRIGTATLFLLRHWLAIFIGFFGAFNILPFLAPVAMRLGWTGIGNTIYTIYSMLCHQMAQRSLFLFGPSPMFNLDRLPVVLSGNTVTDMQLLRAFRGTASIGWKVAWSDRMVYMYGSLLLAAIVYWLVSRRRVRRAMPIWLFILFLVPMGVDGLTHMISDLSGLTADFRYTNVWLADLTRNALPTWFYVGDALGSFNSWMRLITGTLFGVAMAWLMLPILDAEMRYNAHVLSAKLNGTPIPGEANHERPAA